MRYLPYGVSAMLLAIPAYAADSCITTPQDEVCQQVFGGEKTTIPLSSKACSGKKMQLMQLSTRLMMPIGDPITLSQNDCDGVSLLLPEVKEKIIFALVDASHAQKDAYSLPSTKVMVYPNNLWEPLKTWSKNNHLIVNDHTHKLTKILEQHEINYSPIMLPEDKKSKRICVWVGEEEPTMTCKSLLVLHEKTEGLAHIHTYESLQGIRVDVRMPILDQLADNPLTQETFIDLIQSTLKGESL